MVILRTTRRLATRLSEKSSSQDPRSSGQLGDWYANLIRGPGRLLALCTNERTLLSVVVPVAPNRHFLDRFRDAAIGRIHQLPVPASLRLAEAGHFTELSLAPTASRSVVSSMNQLGWGAELWLRSLPAGDLEELGLWLCDTPMSALKTDWPWKEAVLRLTGVRPPEFGKTGPRADGS
ncbi:MAG: hypothetical protein ABJC74_17415 [Gemmatimonadota bacterium]